VSKGVLGAADCLEKPGPGHFQADVAAAYPLLARDSDMSRQRPADQCECRGNGALALISRRGLACSSPYGLKLRSLVRQKVWSGRVELALGPISLSCQQILR